MSPSQWERVKVIFGVAAELPANTRGAFLDVQCPGDPDLRRELDRMLSAHDTTSAVIDRPAFGSNPFGTLFAEKAFRDGEQVGERYVITRLVGEGGMGQVFEALDEQTGMLVAVKTLRPQFANDPALLERFRREMRLVERVQHPNVCRVLEHAAGATPVYFVMELLGGETLAALLRREGCLDPLAAFAIVKQLASALDAAHEAGVVHRDLKPANVMLVGRRAVVTDFGVARAERRLDHETDFTTTGDTAMGTPAYMAPEQIEGRTAGPAADIYALGAVFYEMLSGQQPYAGTTPLAVIARKLKEPVTPLRRRLPNLERRWDEAIQRCMAIRPEDRFSRAADLVAMLEGNHWSGFGPRVATFLRNRRAGTRLLAGLAAAAALMAGGWIAYDWSGRDSARSATALAGGQQLGQQDFAVFTFKIPAKSLAGRRIRYAGWIRTANVKDGEAHLWFRADTVKNEPAAYRNLGSGRVTGTNDWKQYSVELLVPADVVDVFFGATATGSGKAWFDDLSLEVDGERYPVADRDFEGVAQPGDFVRDGELDASVFHGGKQSVRLERKTAILLARTEWRDPETNVRFDLPEGWSIAQTQRWGKQETTVALKDALVSAGTRPALYYRMERLPIARTPEEVEKSLLGGLLAKAGQRSREGVKDYKERAASRRRHEVGGRPALTWIADFTARDDKPIVELFTYIQSENTTALFFSKLSPDDLAVFQERFAPVVDSLRIP